MRQVIKFGNVTGGKFQWNGEWRIAEGATSHEMINHARMQLKTSKAAELLESGMEPGDPKFLAAIKEIDNMTCIGDEVMSH